MPSPFNGKWRLVEVSGVREFADAVHVPEIHRVRLLALAEELARDPEYLIEEIKIHEVLGHVHRYVHIKGHPVKDLGEHKFGVEFEGLTADDRPARIRAVLETDHKIIRHEHGEGFNVVTTFEVHGDQLHVTGVGNGATHVLRFVRI